ncbi:F0F1 ATP synthase subunit delta [Mycoplasma sp. 'Moose RK']|uniref:F0F1 ATP synthase subunit delta n=1 Tax=Mycoplasma sp. 'Moose RK' TaxID=2780095 RepID=UPI0018C1D94C|nr:F0F1 ATP synthase subunit delta [Mycoplasma sp. 'Moose RK']MBG0731005.1 F0F1 ATP synthase subunit delta [Mycoplasma sp. 'Moose RK']
MTINPKIFHNYAESLLEIAVAQNSVDKFLTDSFFVLEIIQEQRILLKIFGSHFISKQEKFDLIDKIFVEKIDKLFTNFLKVVVKNNVFSYLKIILKSFITQANHFLSQDFGKIETAFPLTATIISRLEKKVGEKLKRKVKLTQKINPNLISGIKIIVDNHIFENSVDSQLKSLRQTLLQTKSKKNTVK